MRSISSSGKISHGISLSSILLKLLEHPTISGFALQLVKLPSFGRRFILISNDIVLCIASIYLVLGVRLSHIDLASINTSYATAIFLVIIIRQSSLYIFGLYRQLLRYLDNSLLGLTIKAVIFSEVASQIIFSVISLNHLPRSVRLVSGLLFILLIFISRLVFTKVLSASDNRSTSQLGNIVYSARKSVRQSPIPTVIYGAGAAGFILNNLLASEQYKVIAFVDDNPALQGRMITGTPVCPPSYLDRIIAQFKIEEAFIAVPSANSDERRRIVQKLKSLCVSIKTVPSVAEIVSGKLSFNQIRTIDIIDLLGREEVFPDPDLLSADIRDKVVLVTGAGGSIGSELCRQIARQEPRCLVLYELNEFALYSIDIELTEIYPEIKCKTVLGSVTEPERLESIMLENNVDTVYHAAAYKHVPLVEANPSQGIINNTLGTWSAAHSAMAAGVSTFVLISTDKAVRPTNIMGASKRAAELVLQALAHSNSVGTRFSMVRFGNVLNSSGSVVPRFRKQIANRQPLTLTHPDITRYFMSIPEAARLVIQAGAMAKGGEVFLLDMGEPVKIYDLAVQMIELSGLTVGKDIGIEITGLRPGEKLYEELLIDSENSIQSQHPKIFCASERMIPLSKLEMQLEKLFYAAQNGENETIISLLKALVPEYNPRKRDGHVSTGRVKKDSCLTA